MSIKRVIAVATLIVVPLTVSLTTLAAPAAPRSAPMVAAAVPAQVTSEGAQYADTVPNKANELRSSLNLQSMTRCQELDAVVRDRSEQQAAANNVSHCPDFTSAYPSGRTTGSENVAWRTAGGDTGAQIFNQWFNSLGHYKSMTDPNINSIGVGFTQTSDGKWYTTQNFAVYNVSSSTLTPLITTTTNAATTATKSNTPPKTADAPPTDTAVSSPTPTPEITPSALFTEMTAPAPTVPPTSETITPASTPSAPTVTVTVQTVMTIGIPAKPSTAPAVVAPRTTLTKPAPAIAGPGIAVAIAAAGLSGIGAVLVTHRRQASQLSRRLSGRELFL